MQHHAFGFDIAKDDGRGPFQSFLKLFRREVVEFPRWPTDKSTIIIKPLETVHKGASVIQEFNVFFRGQEWRFNVLISCMNAPVANVSNAMFHSQFLIRRFGETWSLETPRLTIAFNSESNWTIWKKPILRRYVNTN